MKRMRFDIGGMHCKACVASIDAVLREMNGVHGHDTGMNFAEVTFDESVCGPGEIVSVIRSAGAFEVLGFGTIKE